MLDLFLTGSVTSFHIPCSTKILQTEGAPKVYGYVFSFAPSSGTPTRWGLERLLPPWQGPQNHQCLESEPQEGEHDNYNTWIR